MRRASPPLCLPARCIWLCAPRVHWTCMIGGVCRRATLPIGQETAAHESCPEVVLNGARTGQLLTPCFPDLTAQENVLACHVRQ